MTHDFAYDNFAICYVLVRNKYVELTSNTQIVFNSNDFFNGSQSGQKETLFSALFFFEYV